MEASTTFRQSFRLDNLPARATVTLRAFKRFAVTINGMAVNVPAPPKSNWKDFTELDVAGMLRAETNQIVVTVMNSNGPPALWLSMEAGSFRLHSDRDWEASQEGTDWKKARLASDPPQIEKGDLHFAGESAGRCFLKQMPLLLLFAVLSTGIVIAGSGWLRRNSDQGEVCATVHSTKFVLFVLAGMAASWIALFANNSGKLPVTTGFDVEAHLAYINFIKTNHSVPLANQGWEMYNPPLYYFISAALAALFKLDVSSIAATELFRGFGLLVGVTHIVLICLCLRLVFHGRLGMQLFGLILAACLPEHLYISQYVTNESLAAAWVTGAIYFCLRLFKAGQHLWQYSAAAGICLGAALLTKVTAIVTIPFFAGALLVWLVLQRIRSVRIWTTTLGLFMITTLVVCGWHYLRVWKAFGTPFVFAWDPASGSGWWAEDGFRTTTYFTRFGRSLTQPFFSSFYGFADGIYSTFWGDGLCGGSDSFINRPPWNYELVATGMLLALLPTVIILTGLAACLRKAFREPGPVWFLLLGIPLAAFVTLVYLNLKVPFNCNVKAFYGLIALFPICALGSAGWEIWHRHARGWRPVLCIAFGVWALNAYASHWIRGDTYSTYAARGLQDLKDHRYDGAVKEFSAALKMEPDYAEAHLNLGDTLTAQGKLPEAIQHFDRALQLKPDDAEAHLDYAKACYNLGNTLAKQGKLPEAIQQYQRALQLNPDYFKAHLNLGNALKIQGKLDEAILHYRQALQLNPDFAEAHFSLGIALKIQGEPEEAVRHLQQALDLATVQNNPALAEAARTSLKAFTPVPSPAQQPQTP
jgi:tetratricopeptide (TPR) repeat protein